MILTMRRTFFLLAGIVAISILLRFYQLGDVPVGLHRDEAFLGYNAYSIAKTGRDMTGKFLPLHSESFLYSPMGYSYISLPFITFFGLNAFSVRFASALFGSLTILVTFFLVRQLFFTSKIHEQLGLASAFFLAISPWHINVSRTATENTIVVFFIALGVLAYAYWMRTYRWYYLVGAFASFGITLGIYQAPRIFLPFFLPLLFFTFWKQIKKQIVMNGLLFFIIILLPFVFILQSPSLSLRIRTVSIFANTETQLTLDEQIREDGLGNRFLTRFYHNKFTAYGAQVLQNYFDHFSYRFLFIGDALPLRYRIPNSGLLYLFELPLLLLGLWSMLRDQKRLGYFFAGWVLLAPVGSALTFDDIPNLQRTLIIFPALSIIAAYGLVTLGQNVKMYRRLLIAIGGIFILLSILQYLHQYYIHAVVHQPWYRQEGYQELVKKVDTRLSSYQKAIITNRETAPTIFFLFYGKYDPATFQKETKNSVLRDFDRVGFATYEFSQEECPLRDVTNKDGSMITTGQQGILYVDSGFCKNMTYGRLLNTIERSDHSNVFKIYDLP